MGFVFKFDIKQINQDLFSAFYDETFNLVHCVSQGFVMIKGSALNFKNKYRMIDELMAQSKRKWDK